MAGPNLALTVKRGQWTPPDGKHIELRIEPVTARFGADDWTVRNIDAERRVLGILARVAVDVQPALALAGRDHGCDGWLPEPADRDDIAEIRRPARHEGCHAYLDDLGLDDGYLPGLDVVVPRNRERAWTERLNATIQKIGAADIEIFERISPACATKQ